VRQQRRHAIVLALTALTAAAIPAGAQQRATRPQPRPEVRVDYLARSPDAIHAGIGLNVPLGTYVRVELVGAGGPSWNDGRSGASARADVITRFSFDPFLERRWGVSAGGGVSLRYDELSPSDDRWRPLIAIVLDLEGPVTGPVTPALQIGLGGGARVGMVLRAADRFRR
jgi:hypothetical protein